MFPAKVHMNLAANIISSPRRDVISAPDLCSVSPSVLGALMQSRKIVVVVVVHILPPPHLSQSLGGGSLTHVGNLPPSFLLPILPSYASRLLE